MIDKYICFLNTLRNEDSTLSGVIATDNNGFKVRWGLNEKFHPGASAMTFEQAMKVYNSDYWPEGLENISSQVIANMVFDFGFNHGKESSVTVFQAWLGVQVDGVIGPETIAAAGQWSVPKTVESLVVAIEAEYQKIGGPYVDAWIYRVRRNAHSWGY